MKPKNEDIKKEIKTMSNFRRELESLINKNSMENNSNTPDWILAEFLTNCLQAFDLATRQRDQTKNKEIEK